MKICSDCHKEKPLDAFYKLAHALFGVSHICIDCHKIRSKLYYEANKKLYKERASAWAKNNPVKRKEVVNNWDERHKAQRVEKWKNKNKILRENDLHGERIKGRNNSHIRRSRMNDVFCNVTPEILKEIIFVSEGICVYCGTFADKITIDHFIAVSNGGVHEISNLVPCCKSCNSSKRNFEAVAWIEKSGFVEAFDRINKFKQQLYDRLQIPVAGTRSRPEEISKRSETTPDACRCANET